MAMRRLFKMNSTCLMKLFLVQGAAKTVFGTNKYHMCSSTKSVFRRLKTLDSLKVPEKVRRRSLVTATNAWRVNVGENIVVIHENGRNPPLHSNTRPMSNVKPGAKKRSTIWTFSVYFGGAVLVTGLCSLVYMKHYLDRKGMHLFYIPHLPVQIFSPFGKFRGTIVSMMMLNSIGKAENFSVRKDDTFVVSFPRSGTTWTQEIVYLIANEADTEKACSRNLEERFPYLEDLDRRVMQGLDASDSPRFIKSHLPYRMLPEELKTKRPKIIYVMRNPKDVVVSFYHLWQKLLMGGYRGPFEDFCDLFLTDRILFSPWLDHVQGFWDRRHDDNILFIHYEDLISNLPHEIQKIAKFLDRPLSDSQLEVIVDHCSFDSMKQNDKVNYNWWDGRFYTSNIGTSFIRKGRVGDWQNYFTPELNARMGAKVDKGLKEMGIDVKYVIK